LSHNGAGDAPGSILARCIFLVYARHGRELMGCKSPVFESGTVVISYRCQLAVLR